MLNSAEPARFCPLSQTSTQLVMYDASSEAKEDNGLSDVVHCAHSAQPYCVDEAILLGRVGQSLHAFGPLDRPGHDRIDADAVMPPLDGEVLHQRVDAAPVRTHVRLEGTGM